MKRVVVLDRLGAKFRGWDAWRRIFNCGRGKNLVFAWRFGCCVKFSVRFGDFALHHF